MPQLREDLRVLHGQLDHLPDSAQLVFQAADVLVLHRVGLGRVAAGGLLNAHVRHGRGQAARRVGLVAGDRERGAAAGEQGHVHLVPFHQRAARHVLADAAHFFRAKGQAFLRRQQQHTGMGNGIR